MFEGCLCPAQHETLQAGEGTQETLEKKNTKELGAEDAVTNSVCRQSSHILLDGEDSRSPRKDNQGQSRQKSTPVGEAKVFGHSGTRSPWCPMQSP